MRVTLCELAAFCFELLPCFIDRDFIRVALTDLPVTSLSRLFA
jgi:hypothetical protein